MAIRAEPSFSLKDRLLNADTLAQLSDGLSRALPEFDRSRFESRVLARFPELELMERIHWIVEVMWDTLPGFPDAVSILRGALPPPLDPTLSDDDFGEYIWIVPGVYVATYGCSEEHLTDSLAFLREATTRVTSEKAIRPFLKAFPDRTMAEVREWATAANYHVRRLASEGIRPYLPWAVRVLLPPEDVIAVLDTLHADPTRYVTRSVANTLNDLSREHPDLALSTVGSWRDAKRQEARELRWMTRHALRTLIKRDHTDALRFLGYESDPDVRVSDVTASKDVVVGESFVWTCRLESRTAQRLKVGMKIHFLKANGSLRPKAFALKDLELDAGESIDLVKKQPFKPITTRTLYPGTHRAELIVNGKVMATREFDLLAD